MVIMGKLFQYGLTGGAWRDWPLYTDSQIVFFSHRCNRSVSPSPCRPFPSHPELLGPDLVKAGEFLPLVGHSDNLEAKD